MIYASNIFDINHVDTLIYLRQSVPYQRLNQIRVLNFTWNFWVYSHRSPVPHGLATWREACNVLASFTGLQELTVHLSGQNLLLPGVFYKDRWGPLLEALARITPAKKFEVFLRWEEDECAEAAKGAEYPFKLVSTASQPLVLRDPYTMEL
jgi:hypothetical protein